MSFLFAYLNSVIYFAVAHVSYHMSHIIRTIQHASQVMHAFFTNNTASIITAEWEGQVRLTQVFDNKTKLINKSVCTQNVTAACEANQGRTLVLALKSNTINIFRCDKNNAIINVTSRQFEGDRNYIWALKTTPDDQHVVVGSTNGCLYTIRLNDGCTIQTIALQNKIIFSIDIYSDGVHAVVGTRQGYIFMVDFIHGRIVKKFDCRHNSPFVSSIQNLCLTPNKKFILYAMSNEIYAIHSKSGKKKYCINIHECLGDKESNNCLSSDSLLSSSFSTNFVITNGRYIVHSCNKEKRICVRRIETGNLVHTIDVDGWIWCLGLSKNDQLLYWVSGKRVMVAVNPMFLPECRRQWARSFRVTYKCPLRLFFNHYPGLLKLVASKILLYFSCSPY